MAARYFQSRHWLAGCVPVGLGSEWIAMQSSRNAALPNDRRTRQSWASVEAVYNFFFSKYPAVLQPACAAVRRVVV